jgi:hypothetical protein
MQLSRSDAESKLIKDHPNREAPLSCMSMAYKFSSMIQVSLNTEVKVVSDNHLNSDSEGPKKTLGLDEGLGNCSDRQRQFSTSGSILGTVAPPCEYSGTHGRSPYLIRRTKVSTVQEGANETK